MLEKAPWCHKLVAPSVFYLVSISFLHLKKLVAHIQRSENSWEEKSYSWLSFKSKSSGHAVQCSHVANVNPSGKRAAFCRHAEDLLPHHPVLGDIWACDPCSKAITITQGFYQTHLESTLHPSLTSVLNIWRTTVLNIIQSTSEIERCASIYLKILVYVLLQSLRQKVLL